MGFAKDVVAMRLRTVARVMSFMLMSVLKGYVL